MTPIKTILHPTDFSEPSRAAFELACTLARSLGAKLLVLHVRPMPVVMPPSELMAIPSESDELRASLRKQLDALEPPDPKIDIERYLLVGDEVEEILDAADEKGCDLIVMGTHGRTGLSRVLMGSVAEKVLRKAPCAVVTVKAPSNAKL